MECKERTWSLTREAFSLCFSGNRLENVFAECEMDVNEIACKLLNLAGLGTMLQLFFLTNQMCALTREQKDVEMTPSVLFRNTPPHQPR